MEFDRHDIQCTRVRLLALTDAVYSASGKKAGNGRVEGGKFGRGGLSVA